VRDFGLILDTALSFGPHPHVNQLVSRCFYQLRRIKSSVRALPTEATKTVVNSLVVSRIDYCNSLLAGAPQYQLDRLQAVMNTATRLIYGVGKFDRIQHLISDRLHWLPVHKRVQFKLCLLAYNAVHGLAPHYVADMCRPVSSVDARRKLRSAAREDLIIPRTATKFGACSFTISAPSEWNRLPLHIGPGLASVRSRMLALLLGIDFQKLSARHKHNRTSRILKKHFYLMNFYDCILCP